MKVKQYLNLTLTTGGTVNVPTQMFQASGGSFNGDQVRITGTATLASAFNVSPSGTPANNTVITTHWEAACTPGAHAITIFGLTIPTHLAAKKFFVVSEYSSGAWVSYAVVSLAESDVITGDHIKNFEIDIKSKIEAETLGDVIVFGGGTLTPTLVNLGTDGLMLVGSTASGATARAMSGHATMDALGVVTIGSSVITSAMIVAGTITGSDIDAATITAVNLDAEANKTQISIPISFEDAAEVGVIDFKVCFDCTIDGIHGTVTKPMTSTATHIFKDAGGTVLTGSQIDMSNALTLGNIVSVTPTANNVFSAGDVIRIETSLSGAVGGKSVLMLCATKT